MTATIAKLPATSATDRAVRKDRLGGLGGAGPLTSRKGGASTKFGTVRLVKMGGSLGRSNKGRNHAEIREAVSDVAIGMIGGYVGTQVMERGSMESEEDRRKGVW